MSYFRAVATDLDGTLAYHDEVDPEVIEALREIRTRGIRTVLVTGRILAELRQVFPTLEDEFDLVVAENGGVLSGPTGVRPLSSPVDPDLAQALTRRDVPIRVGRVLLACGAGCEEAVAEEVRRSGYELQLVRNRGALMVLPPGVNKGTGVMEALGDLGISRHSTVALGDAENDHSLLAACELAVAVADAVFPLQQHADVVLEKAGAEGVTEFLRGSLFLGDERALSPRWQLKLGRCMDGDDGAFIPASQVNVLVSGGTVSGKSYLAGLAAEQLAAMGYSVAVLDLEGDHAHLASLRGVLGFSHGRLPDPEDLPGLLTHRFSSVVLDLSLEPLEEKRAYARRVLTVLLRLRKTMGLPHWVVLEEAHHVLTDPHFAQEVLSDPVRGLFLVSWRPVDLPEAAWNRIDVLAAMCGREAAAGGTPEIMAHVSGKSPETMAELLEGTNPGEFLLLNRDVPDRGVRRCRMGERRTNHIRHWRKYADAALPPGRGFFFHRPEPHAEPAQASNLREFVHILAVTDPDTILHHADRSDFSRWIRTTVQDAWLASVVASTEEEVRADGDIDTARRQILDAIRFRYGA